MPKNRTLSFVVFCLLGLFFYLAGTPVLWAQETRTTAELLRDAQIEFDAGRLVEALEIVIAIQPVENEQNVPQYGIFDPVWDDDIEDVRAMERNEFYQKDVFLVKLVNAFLRDKQFPVATRTALQISLNWTRDQTLRQITNAQLADLAESVRTGRIKPNEVDEIIANTFADVLDNLGWKNNIYNSIAQAMFQAGNLSAALKLAENIPNRQARGNLLFRWVQFDLRMQESVHDTILDTIDDPKIKFQMLFYLLEHRNARTSPEKRLEWLGVIVDTFGAFDPPSEEESRTLLKVADFYRELDMDEKAQAVSELVDPRLRKIVLAEKLVAKLQSYLNQISSFERSLHTAITFGQRTMPEDLQEQLDLLILRAFDCIEEADDADLVDTWLIRLLNPLTSKELYQKIHEMFLATNITLTEDQKIHLTSHYSSRFRRPELSKQEQFEGIKEYLIPLALDIYLNSRPDRHYPRERSVYYLSQAFSFLLHDGRVDKWIELIDSLDVPHPFLDEVLDVTAFWHANRGGGYFWLINYLCFDRSPSPDIVYSASPSPDGIERAVLAYRPGHAIDGGRELWVERKIERVEKLFISRITNEAIKAKIREELKRRSGGLSSISVQDWDNRLTAAQRETSTDMRFRRHLEMIYYPLPEGRDILPVLNGLKEIVAQGAGNISFLAHLEHKISLFDISHQYPFQSFFSAEVRTQLQQSIERDIGQLTSQTKFQKQLAFSSILLRRTAPPGRLFPEESIRLEHLTHLLELARNVPEATPAERMEAYWWLSAFARHIMMPTFAIQIADEALAFGETVPAPNHGGPTPQVFSQVRRAIDGIGVLKGLLTK